MPRRLAMALVALFFVACVQLTGAPATASDAPDTPPVPTTVHTSAEPGPTEAIILDDVDVRPIMAGTAGMLVALSFVAVRRGWLL